MKELWKKINGYDYEISNYGRVRNKDGYIMKLKGQRYLNIGLHRGKEPQKFFLIHRLVAIAFVPGRTEEKKQVNHIDGNRKNNRWDNLEWCTQSYNMKHAYKIGLEKPNIKCLMENADKLKKKFVFKNRDTGIEKRFSCIKEAALYIGCNEKTIRNIKKGEMRSRTGWEVVNP